MRQLYAQAVLVGILESEIFVEIAIQRIYVQKIAIIHVYLLLYSKCRRGYYMIAPIHALPSKIAFTLWAYAV